MIGHNVHLSAPTVGARSGDGPMNLVKVCVTVPQKRIEFSASRGMSIREAKREMRAIVAELNCAGIGTVSESPSEVRMVGGARIWIG